MDPDERTNGQNSLHQHYIIPPAVVSDMRHQPDNLLVDKHTDDQFVQENHDNVNHQTPLDMDRGSNLNDNRILKVCYTSSCCARGFQVCVDLLRGTNSDDTKCPNCLCTCVL